MSREPQYAGLLTYNAVAKRNPRYQVKRPNLRQPPPVHLIIHPPPLIADLFKMNSGDLEFCTSRTSQDFGQATLTNTSQQPLSITASDIAPITMLVDEVLPEILACYVIDVEASEYLVKVAWHKLAHVC